MANLAWKTDAIQQYSFAGNHIICQQSTMIAAMEERSTVVLLAAKAVTAAAAVESSECCSSSDSYDLLQPQLSQWKKCFTAVFASSDSSDSSCSS